MPPKPCAPGKIRNPETGRCVDADGKIGKRVKAKKPVMPVMPPMHAMPTMPNDVIREIAKRVAAINTNTALQMRAVARDFKHVINTSPEIAIPRTKPDIQYANLVKGLKQLVVDADAFCKDLPVRGRNMWQVGINTKALSFQVYRDNNTASPIKYSVLVTWHDYDATVDGTIDNTFFNEDDDFIKYNIPPSSHHLRFRTREELFHFFDSWPNLAYELTLTHESRPNHKFTFKTFKAFLVEMMHHKPRFRVFVSCVVAKPGQFPKTAANILKRKRIWFAYYSARKDQEIHSYILPDK